MPSQTAVLDARTISFMTVDDDEFGPCPHCGYPGLEYDREFRAWVHDWCGYWKDDA